MSNAIILYDSMLPVVMILKIIIHANFEQLNILVDF